MLNREAAKYGLHFPVKEIQFGKSVTILDLTAYLDSENAIQYKGYTKPTDAKRYLNTKSFHPSSVFKSIPYSQMIRTMENNSKEDTKTVQITELIKHFENSGYNKQLLQQLKEKATEKRVLPTKLRNDLDKFQNEKNTVVESQIKNMNLAIGSLSFKLAAVCERLNKLDQKLDYSQRR